MRPNTAHSQTTLPVRRRRRSWSMVGILVAGVAMLATACVPNPDGGGSGPESGIVHVTTEVISHGNVSVTADFYRNEDLTCGRQGKFTFAVIEPHNNVGGEAPLWVYLHGGGIGYYEPDDDPTDGILAEYVGDESNNDEESLHDLVRRVYSPGDTIMMRRLAEGWRILVPSMCDHDLHSGRGTEYPNNPHHGEAGDTVDGLDANIAALTYVADHRPTTWVVAHGTSAGSVGAFSLAHEMHDQGVDLNAAIMDAYLITPRLTTIFDAGVTPQQAKNPDFDNQAVIDKVGRFADIEGPDGMYPEKAIDTEDFRAVPLLDVVGTDDPHCGGAVAPVPGVPTDLGNCEYVHKGFADAIAAQNNSPHGSILVQDGGHSTTKDPGLALHDDIDIWLAAAISAHPGHHPFG